MWSIHTATLGLGRVLPTAGRINYYNNSAARLTVATYRKLKFWAQRIDCDAIYKNIRLIQKKNVCYSECLDKKFCSSKISSCSIFNDIPTTCPYYFTPIFSFVWSSGFSSTVDENTNSSGGELFDYTPPMQEASASSFSDRSKRSMFIPGKSVVSDVLCSED